MAGGRSCTPGSGPGSSTRYCCSDTDYCNGTIRHTMSMFGIIFLLTALLVAKFNFF